MELALSDDQREMQANIERYLAEQCPMERVQQIFNSADGYDAQVWRGLTELGVTALGIPAAYGGMGLELLDLALVAESLGAAATPGPFLGHVLASLAIAWYGNERQRAQWLPRLATGECLATVALAEEGGRWQPDEWTLDGTKALTGTKMFVPYASRADLLVVGLRGGGLALVESPAAALRCTPLNAVDRTRRVDTVDFRDCAADPLPESPPQSLARWRDAALVLLAADAFGGASRCVRMAVDYANIRVQFGCKIGQFQGLKYQIVDTAIEVEPARGLYWYAAHAFSHAPQEAKRLIALCKAHLTTVYLQAARNMIEVHGGIGYTWEFHAHLYLKRAMFDYAFFGGADTHRRRAIELAQWQAPFQRDSKGKRDIESIAQ